MATNNSDQRSVEWNSEIELTDNNSEYDREARGTLTIDGPEGRLVIKKTYRAMVGHPRGLMETGKVKEHSTYFRKEDTEPFTDSGHSWDVPEDGIEDDGTFLSECRAAMEADPEVEYEQHKDRL